MSVFWVETTRTTDDGIRSVLVHASGDDDDEVMAQVAAAKIFGGPAFTSFRSHHGDELLIYFTDRIV